ncbi:NDP-hexose 2,3-dehydratase family protein [Nonomuraea sp. CA-218870]|uniref:NDP-hexose 2,3-dehydratase family protein n=1 Tax=Nonomuraea sp. CA-218870 TaxID=3239998 RepID=UPI003D8D8DB3
MTALSADPSSAAPLPAAPVPAAPPAGAFTLSALRPDGGVLSTDAFHRWWRGRLDRPGFEVTRIPFDELEGWAFDPESGNLRHHSGRFFSIEGFELSTDGSSRHCQPIINQPEIGILGILVKEFDGVLHCLMQAKFEPGNVNTWQLSPTVQATRSNYTRVHKGDDTPYVQYFREAHRHRVLVDVLQSEQGAWFWRKRNRNIVIQVEEDVEPHEDYCWVTLGQVRRMFPVDNFVNMDARTVLSCMPFHGPGAPAAGDAFSEALARSYGAADPSSGALRSPGELVSWLTEAKCRCEWKSRLIPLKSIARWSRTDDELVDQALQGFSIIAVRVAADNREVKWWTQPLLATRTTGVAVFLARPIDGVLHFLVRAQPEPGLLDLVEMAPSVHMVSGLDTLGAHTDHPLVLERALGGEGVRFDSLMSEEGGRFYHAQTRYKIVEVGEDFPVDVPWDYCWVTARQLMDLLGHGHYLNIEARSLVACVHSLW